MAYVDGLNGNFERNTLRSFLATDGFRLQYIPLFQSVDDRLLLYRKLIRKQSPQPDLYEIDVIWPALLADGLLDLKPYLGADLNAFAPELIEAYTVQGRLVAIPTYVDEGILFYRTDLLRRYGFGHPPQTWDELEYMSKVIQAGERWRGNKDFWGYVWQGRSYEGLTCNALEWQASQGGGQILGSDRTVQVNNPNTIHALKRASSWVGTISPPGVLDFDEDDSFNVWKSGNAAFLRNWIYLYGSAKSPSCRVNDRFALALVPGTPRSPNRTLGGLAVAVSRYSEHKQEAIAAARYLMNSDVQRLRAKEMGSVPTRIALQKDVDLMRYTPLQGPLATQSMKGVLSRPSVLAGTSYDAVSTAYSSTIHSVLSKQVSPEIALQRLEERLVRITGFKPSQQGSPAPLSSQALPRAQDSAVQ